MVRFAWVYLKSFYLYGAIVLCALAVVHLERIKHNPEREADNREPRLAGSDTG